MPDGARTAYYNEHDPRAAAWLRELIAAGLIAPGDVDERSIADVRADDLVGYRQCHFFAGIGGWSYALRLAGVPDDAEVWTGSCPCQPFSQAGAQRGTADERHLWPEFARLIRECRPAKVFGEQVASRLGREWLAGVFADLETMGYAVAGADLCAASCGAPHIRQRLYWVADADGWHASTEGIQRGRKHEQQPQDGGADRLADASRGGLGIDGSASGRAGYADQRGEDGRLANSERGGIRSGGHGSHACASGGMQSEDGERQWVRDDAVAVGGMGDADDAGSQGRSERGDSTDQCPPWPSSLVGQGGHWDGSYWLECRDGKARRVPTQSRVQCVVDGLPNGVDDSWLDGFPLSGKVEGRVALLRGYGNAIVPQVAAAFVRASHA